MKLTEAINEGLAHAAEYGSKTVSEAYGAQIENFAACAKIHAKMDHRVSRNSAVARTSGMAQALVFMRAVDNDPRCDHLKDGTGFDKRHRHRLMFIEAFAAHSGFDALEGETLSNHAILARQAALTPQTDKDRAVIAAAKEFHETGESPLADQFEAGIKGMGAEWRKVYDTEKWRENEHKEALKADRRAEQIFGSEIKSVDLKPKIQKVKVKSNQRVR